jgi:hypothetical protein
MLCDVSRNDKDDMDIQNRTPESDYGSFTMICPCPTIVTTHTQPDCYRPPIVIMHEVCICISRTRWAV